MKYRIAIVEDEKQTRKLLKSYIDRYALEYKSSFHVLEFEDGDDILMNYKSNYDIIFLDIEMKFSNGMEIAEEIRKIDSDVIIIFVTYMAQYAIKGYAVDALSFLLKPVPYFAFSQEFKRSIQKLDKREDSFIMISTDLGIKKINTNEIYYIESMKHNLIIKTIDGDIKTRGVMREMENELNESHFFRCNNFYLVNLSKVKGINGEYATVGYDELKMSRGRKKAFMEALTTYIGEVK